MWRRCGGMGGPNSLSDRNPAKTHVFTNSCSEPYFYRVNADWRGKLGGINTDICPLYLLTGAYDFSCTQEDTKRTAAAVPGAKVKIMEEMGHFPTGVNPARFREYILPVLEEIRQSKGS